MKIADWEELEKFELQFKDNKGWVDYGFIKLGDKFIEFFKTPNWSGDVAAWRWEKAVAESLIKNKQLQKTTK